MNKLNVAQTNKKCTKPIFSIEVKSSKYSSRAKVRIIREFKSVPIQMIRVAARALYICPLKLFASHNIYNRQILLIFVTW